MDARKRHRERERERDTLPTLAALFAGQLGASYSLEEGKVRTNTHQFMQSKICLLLVVGCFLWRLRKMWR